MQDDKINELEMIKAGRWPQNQMSFVLIIGAFILGCCYMVNAIMQVLDTF